MTWHPTRWRCEDCGTNGEDWGVPERCPDCGSVDTTPDLGAPPLDLDHYDRVRDERLEAELERRES